MQEQNSNKAVAVIKFAIHGVEGFKSVMAANGKPGKRMYSALNEMDRRFKEQDEELSRSYGEAVETNSADVQVKRDQCSAVRKAIRLISTIRDRVTHHRDLEQFSFLGQEFPITTEQFLAKADHIYRENTAIFLSNLDAIDRAIDDHLARLNKNAPPPKPPLSDLEPSICICTGGIFGDKPFYLFMTQLDARDTGNGDFQQAIRHFIYTALITVKNMKLTDYLRLKGNERERTKQALLFIDQHLDLLREIQVVNAGSVMSTAGVSNKHDKTIYQQVKTTTDTLMLEAEERLISYILRTLAANASA